MDSDDTPDEDAERPDGPSEPPGGSSDSTSSINGDDLGGHASPASDGVGSGSVDRPDGPSSTAGDPDGPTATRHSGSAHSEFVPGPGGSGAGLDAGPGEAPGPGGTSEPSTGDAPGDGPADAYGQARDGYDGSAWAPPPPQPRVHRPWLWRSDRDRDLAGVLGGLSEKLGLESRWLRLLVVAAAAFLAFGVANGLQLLIVLPYAAAWALMPTQRSRSLLMQLPRRAAIQELGLIAILVIVSTVMVAQPAIGLVAVLGGVAALLLRDRPPSDDDVPPAGPSGGGPTYVPPATGGWPVDATASAPGAYGSSAPGGGPYQPQPGVATWAAPAVPPAAPPPRRARPTPRPKREPALWPLAGGLVAVIAVVFVAGLLGGWALDVRLVVNSLLAVIGGVMLLSAWRGRARVLLLVVPILLPLWFATSAADIGGYDGVGMRRAAPTGAIPDEPLAYEVEYGGIALDLTGLDMPSGSRTEVVVDVAVGGARVTVPRGTKVELRGDTGLAVVNLPTRWGSDGRASVHDSLHIDRDALGPECRPEQLSPMDLWSAALNTGVDLNGLDEPGIDDPVATDAPATDDSITDETTADDSATDDSATTVPEENPDEPDPGTSPTDGIDDDYDGDIDAEGPTVLRQFDPAFLDAVEDAGFARPRVTGQDTWYSGDFTEITDLAEVHVSDDWMLCVPEPPDPDPPVVLITATIGLGILEVSRV